MGCFYNTYKAATSSTGRECGRNCFWTPHAWALWFFVLNWILLMALTFGGTPAQRPSRAAVSAYDTHSGLGSFQQYNTSTDDDNRDPPWKPGGLTFLSVNGDEVGTAKGKKFDFGVWGWCITEFDSHPKTDKDGPGLLRGNVDYGRTIVVECHPILFWDWQRDHGVGIAMSAWIAKALGRVAGVLPIVTILQTPWTIIVASLTFKGLPVHRGANKVYRRWNVFMIFGWLLSFTILTMAVLLITCVAASIAEWQYPYDTDMAAYITAGLRPGPGTTLVGVVAFFQIAAMFMLQFGGRGFVLGKSKRRIEQERAEGVTDPEQV